MDPRQIEVRALSLAEDDLLVPLHEEVVRGEAPRLDIDVCGTLGILIRTHREDLDTFDQWELLIREVAARPDIWIAKNLCESVLEGLRPTG